MKERTIEGWWFAPPDGLLEHGDGRKPRRGTTHRVEGEIELCGNGLHFSRRLIDAIGYAESNVVYRVAGSGEIIEDSDRVVCSRRKYLSSGVDIEAVSRKFARRCALDVIGKWDAPPVVAEYLRTGDEAIRAAAMAAAMDAAWAATRDSAMAAPWTATRDAAWAAASAATRAAACAAAMDAAWDAAWSAARAAAMAAAWAAAMAAAMDAARAAAWYTAEIKSKTRQNRRLTAMVWREIKRQERTYE